MRFRWRTYLRQATTEQSVVELVRVYLDSWSREEVGKLPPGVWPGAISTAEELVRETLKVGQMHSVFSGARDSLALIQELLLFLTQASVRVRQLSPLPGETAAPPQGKRIPVKDEE